MFIKSGCSAYISDFVLHIHDELNLNETYCDCIAGIVVNMQAIYNV